MDASTTNANPQPPPNAQNAPQIDLSIPITALSFLLQQLRTIGRTDHLPPPNGNSASRSVGHQIQATHQSFHQFLRLFTSQPIQNALSLAKQLEEADPTIVPLTQEEEDRIYPKRRKLTKASTSAVESQDAPWDRAMPQILPPSDSFSGPVVTSSTLLDYIKDLHNTTGGNVTAKIWRVDKDVNNDATPTVLKVELCDTFLIYLTLVSEGSGGLRAEKAVVFGLQEKRLPHLHSEFSVFKKLSQVFSNILSQRPDAPLPLLIELISLYRNMYSTSCSVCGKVMSREDRLPPLERLWQPVAATNDPAPKEAGESKESQKLNGRWIPRHVGCRS
ncbi:hypothetical protein FRB94_013264 [Tulasnella sp. JGI-2019a]|nr:hypothetical protein FRB93_001970 [Tulasnella sp. JGI-2019a]KAG9008440.1 hypothetical protein FRB94_013264 [Tulasnella sp. JGI-2019a]KAG9031445.1 hypothetical protein FRB95_002745 [Tulasnella sp. JGI-2019a]